MSGSQFQQFNEDLNKMLGSTLKKKKKKKKLCKKGGNTHTHTTLLISVPLGVACSFLSEKLLTLCSPHLSVKLTKNGELTILGPSAGERFHEETPL